LPFSLWFIAEFNPEFTVPSTCIDFDNYTIAEFPRPITWIDRFAGLGKLRAIVVYLGFTPEPTIWHEFHRYAIHREAPT
jgi:hypothetical protein